MEHCLYRPVYCLQYSLFHVLFVYNTQYVFVLSLQCPLYPVCIHRNIRFDSNSGSFVMYLYDMQYAKVFMMHMYSIVHKRGGTYVLRRRRRRREVAVRTAPCGPTRQQRMPTSAAHAATAALGPAPAASPPDQGRDGRTWTQPRPAAQKQGGQGGTIDSAPAPAGSALEATDNAGHVVTDWRIVVLKQKIVRRREPTGAPTAPDMLQHASLTPSVIVAHNRLTGQGRTFLTAWQTQPQECSMSECCRCWWPSRVLR